MDDNPFDHSTPVDGYINYIRTLLTLLKESKQSIYFEMISLVERYIAIYQQEQAKPCMHDFFANFIQRIESGDINNANDGLQWISDFFQTPCNRCGMLPTLTEVLNAVTLLCIHVRINI